MANILSKKCFFAQVQMTKIVAEIVYYVSLTVRDQAEPDQMTIPLTNRLPLHLSKTNPNNGLIDRHSRAPFCVHQK